MALLPQGERGPNYELAAKILLGLVKFSSLNRQRFDMSAQIVMARGSDLSGLSETELRTRSEVLRVTGRLGDGTIRVAKGSDPESITGRTFMPELGSAAARLNERLNKLPNTTTVVALIRSSAANYCCSFRR